MKTKIIIKKVINFIQKKLLFYILQLLILSTTIWILKNNIFISQDIGFWSYLMDIRSKITKQLDSKFLNNQQKITLIGIDQKFFENQNISIQGFHRGYYAKALQILTQNNPLSIGVDVFFEKPFNFGNDDENSKTLNTIFKQYDIEFTNALNSKIVLATMYDFNQKKIIKPASDFLKNKTKLGHIHSQIFYNNMNIGIQSFLKDNNSKEIIYPLSIEVFANAYLNSLSPSNNYNINYEIQDIGKFTKILLPKNILYIPQTTLQNGEKNMLTPIYITNPHEINYISLYDLLKGNFKKSDIENKIIYIGAIDPALNDFKETLRGTIPGVLIHINQTLSLQNHDFMYILNNKEKIALIFFIVILNIIIISIFNSTRSNIQIFMLLLSEIIFILIGCIIFSLIGILGNNYSILLPGGTIIIIIFFQIVLTLVFSLIDTYLIKENFQKLFSIYVGERLSKKASKIERDFEEKIAEEKEIAIFFSDIENFTNISEILSPKETINFLNDYLENMSEQIAKNGGFIDKYVGDAIVAFWEQQNGCELAIKAAIANVIIAKQLKQNINIRIGLNFGKVILGDIGSNKYKLNYTIIGDNVNVASRLESVNKHYGTNICISEEFFQQIKNNDEFLIRKLDKILIKGKTSYTTIYEVLPIIIKDSTNDEIQKYKDMINDFQNGLKKYFLGDFLQALEIFSQIKNHKADPVCDVFIKRCNDMIAQKPEKWDGGWKFLTK